MHCRLILKTQKIYLIIISLCFTFAESFDDIFLFVKSSCPLVSGYTNKSLRAKEGRKEERKKERKEGRKEGRKVGRKEGRID